MDNYTTLNSSPLENSKYSIIMSKSVIVITNEPIFDHWVDRFILSYKSFSSTRSQPLEQVKWKSYIKVDPNTQLIDKYYSKFEQGY